jgi:hypothetical protein
MALPIPILDDKLWPQLTEEARGLIPPTSPEWTDFNIHDPGITFIDLFAWLAEIQQYRLNHTSLPSFDRMLALAGVQRASLQPAVVRIELQNAPAMLLPANSQVVAVGKENLPFATLHDRLLTAARLGPIITNAGGRDIVQNPAEASDVAYFEAFGPSPQPGDSLRLGLNPWVEKEVRLTFTLFEDDLPERVPVSAGSGFVPSAVIQWTYLADTGHWEPLAVSHDGTLGFSQSGDVVAPSPSNPQPKNKFYWIRATLASGRFEIVPRINHIRVNVIRARQAQTVGDEDLGQGWGTPDQIVRLSQTPLLLSDTVAAGRFEVGEVIDWQALIMRLAHPEKINDATLSKMIAYIFSQLSASAQAIIKDPTLSDRADPGFHAIKQHDLDTSIYDLAQAFDQLLVNADLFQPAQFPGFTPPPPPAGCGNCDSDAATRRLNRALLRFVFPDLLLSDRVVIQTGNPVQHVEDEPNSWSTWQQVDNFLSSGPADRHFVLDPQTADVLFGNGLNGTVPLTTESIRARFYRASQGAAGNLPSPQTWLVTTRDNTTLRGAAPLAAAGGADPETLASARFRSRKEFRAPWRALTAGDFELLAGSIPGLRIAQVRVLPNWNPQFRNLQIPGDVTLVVLPFSNDSSRPPGPGEGFLATVKNFFEPRRPVTMRLFVIGPNFVPVSIAADLFVKKGASAADTRARAEDAVRRFLDPIRGGQAQKGWPFGRPVFPSEIYQLLARIPGVDYAGVLTLSGQSDNVQPDDLPSLATISLNAIPFEQRGQSVLAKSPCSGPCDPPPSPTPPKPTSPKTGGCGCA